MARGLTAKEEAFAVAVIELRDGAAAHERAYGGKASRKTRQEHASRIAKRPDVAARIQELRDMHARQAGWTIERMEARFVEDWEFARSMGNPGAAVRASTCIAQLYGLFVDKKDITISMRPDEARQVIAALLPKLGAP